MIYKFRIISDESEDFFRVIEIDSAQTMEEFHNAIVDSVGYEKGHVSSFYTSNDEWDREQEISLMDMSDEDTDIPALLMSETLIGSAIKAEDSKLVYVFDFFSDRAFYITLTEISEPEEDKNYPFLSMSNGEAPEQFQVDDELEEIMKQLNIDELDDDFGTPSIGRMKNATDPYGIDDNEEEFGQHENLDDYLDRM